MKKYLLLLFLVFSACEIEEIARQPLLASPLGLNIKTVQAFGGGTGLVLYFYANNPEIYFSGFTVYASTRKEDFCSIGDDAYWPINPMNITDNEARILTNYNEAVSDTNMSIYIGGEMSYPERYTYPTDAVYSDTGDNPEFSLTTFTSLPPKYEDDGETVKIEGGAFVEGTTYYFAVYSYSSIDNEWSLPSNIASIEFEDTFADSGS